MRISILLPLLLLSPTFAFAKSLSKTEILAKTKADVLEAACSEKDGTGRRCLKSGGAEACEKIADEAFLRCSQKMDGVVHATYPDEQSYKRDVFPIVACSLGHMMVIGKEQKNWSDAKECNIELPPGMAIPK